MEDEVPKITTFDGRQLLTENIFGGRRPPKEEAL